MNSTEKVPLKREVMESQLERARASVVPFGAAMRAALAEAGPGAMAVAWMSDLHLHAAREYRDISPFYCDAVDGSANFKVALAELSALEPWPELLILGGDLADWGAVGAAYADEYAELKRVLDEGLPAGFPALPLPGNHDHADGPISPEWHTTWEGVRRPEWPRPQENEDFYHSTTSGGWRFIALDSRAGEPLSERQYRWLSALLQEDDTTPTVVMVHRPFLPVGNWVDHHALADLRSFELLDGCPAVKIVLSGHTHKAAHWEFRGKRHAILPACAYGLPDACGWGVVVLGRDDVQAVFVKELAITSLDQLAMREQHSDGAFRELRAEPFESSPLYSPDDWPRG